MDYKNFLILRDFIIKWLKDRFESDAKSMCNELDFNSLAETFIADMLSKFKIDVLE